MRYMDGENPRFQADCNFGFLKTCYLTAFQSSFLLFEMFEIMLGRPICL